MLLSLFSNCSDRLLFLLFHPQIQLLQIVVLFLKEGDSSFELVNLLLSPTVNHFFEIRQILGFFELCNEAGESLTIVVKLLEIRSSPVLLYRDMYLFLKLFIFFGQIEALGSERLKHFVGAFIFFLIIFCHNFLKDSILMFEFLDSIFIWNGEFVFFVLQLMDGTFELIILIAYGEVVVLLLQKRILIA